MLPAQFLYPPTGVGRVFSRDNSAPGPGREGQEPGEPRRQWPLILARCSLTGVPGVPRAAPSGSRRGCGRPTWPAAHTCARGSTRPAPAGASVLPGLSHSHPAYPREPRGRQGGHFTVLGPGQRRLGQGGTVGGGARRTAAGAWIRGPWTSGPSSAWWWAVASGRAMLLVLLILAASCRSALPREPTIQCGSETGPSPEWMVQHTLTPGDLRDLQVELVKTSVAAEEFSILMNISWILRADASIRLLKATKICVSGKNNMNSYSCVRCNYTEAFQSQTRPSGGKWTFSYVGFPVELSTLYLISAHNIPNANMNEDSPSLSVNFTSPGCLNHVMKYKKQCTEAGSLWDPDITACKKNEKMVEVNFTTNPLGNRYTILIQRDTTLGFSRVLENKLMRTSVAIPVTEESEGAVVQLTPYLHTCGNDCIRREGTVVLCSETSAPIPPDDNRRMLGGWLPLFLVLLVAVWVLAAGIYLTWRQGRSTKTSFPISTMLLPLIKVLVVYPSEICFHHTVCRFTDFLQNYCRSEVILEKWQKKKIAEMGPVQWLTTQKQAADKVVFLLPSDVPTLCDSACGHNEGSARENSQDLFPLAFNLFCSDFSSQTHLHKYLVVYLGGADLKGDYNALSVCPQYHLMKDATAFHTELLKATQSMSVKKRSQACHDSCSPL